MNVPTIFRTGYFQTIHSGYRGYAYGQYRDAEIQGFADTVLANLDINTIVQGLREDC